jgi:predicted DCC family thiol-disulfide oxidoreductase YuxK
VAIQSEEGKSTMNQYNLPLPTEPESVILITGNKSFAKSDAVLRIFKKMNGLYPLLYSFIILPGIIRDPVYNLIARNRYRFFGKQDSCEFPISEPRNK